MFTFLAYRYFLYLYVCFIIDKRLSFPNQFSYPQHFPTLIPVTSCQSIFATFALLLSSQAYDSSASSHFPLPFAASFRVFLSIFLSSDNQFRFLHIGGLFPETHGRPVLEPLCDAFNFWPKVVQYSQRLIRSIIQGPWRNLTKTVIWNGRRGRNCKR